jgi:uncharacterized protein YegJ (DUF2314 family)
MGLKLLAIPITLVVCAGCGEKQSPGAPGTVGGTSADPVVYFSGSDSKMNTAMSKARQTVDRFIKALSAPQPNQSGFSVKKEFPTNGGSGEHIWLVDVKYADGKFTGTVANDPEKVANLKFGDKASVTRGEISDWMFMEDKDTFVGAYTLRVMLDNPNAGPEEAALRKMKFKD